MELRTTFSDLKCKEVINVCDGGRLGCVTDLELDLCTGTILAIVVPGEGRLLGLIRVRTSFWWTFGSTRPELLIACLHHPQRK